MVNINNPVKQMVATIMGSIDGIDWPPSAEYCVNYRLKCWPLGFDDGHKKYFDSKQELDQWMEEQRQWARLEDNEMMYDIYHWDLGPNLEAYGLMGQ